MLDHTSFDVMKFVCKRIVASVIGIRVTVVVAVFIFVIVVVVKSYTMATTSTSSAGVAWHIIYKWLEKQSPPHLSLHLHLPLSYSLSPSLYGFGGREEEGAAHEAPII